MILGKEMLQQVKEKRQFLSDSDSNLICLLIERVLEQAERVEELQEENQRLETELMMIR